VAERSGDTALDSSAKAKEPVLLNHPKRCGASLPTAVQRGANAWSAVAQRSGDTALDSSAKAMVPVLLNHPKRCGASLPTAVQRAKGPHATKSAKKKDCEAQNGR
jgi:hypothetical protein